MCMFAYVSVSMVKGEGRRAIKEEMKVGKEGHCDKKCNILIPQFKPSTSCENGEMNEY